MANLAALCAAVFSLSAKNLSGADNRPPAVRGLTCMRPILQISTSCRMHVSMYTLYTCMYTRVVQKWE